ncbi:Iron-regulated ABC transporter permease protein SufD [Arboricoccus pini]|uniref:Iron-regulated ABC transporter permease protein SufD n=1 Tax=Arboricoccus pini TaxID=1963835 RepID=A0A212QSG8_9PROT|nr:Fe-S cluster assembly protein SufD [Arboricoccus pini]SNB62369.1 Iron-regulated ABC transporter permease protein SufD [Arboricoccus pini]
MSAATLPVSPRPPAARRPQAFVEPISSFAEAFLAQAGRLNGATELGDLRRRRFERFKALGFPNQRAERWHYTNAARFLNRPWHPAAAAELGSAMVTPYLAGGSRARRLIFVNGRPAASLSHVQGLPPGVIFKSIGRVLAEEPAAFKALLDQDREDDGLTALNAAFADNGAWIDIPAGVKLEVPLQLLFLTTVEAGPTPMTHPRVRIKLGAGAELRLIETHVTLGQSKGLTNLVGTVEIGKGASLTHDRLQLLSEGACFVGQLAIDLEAEAKLKQTIATLGGEFVRNEMDARLKGNAIDCLLNGVYMPVGTEHVDTAIRVHHLAPGSHSNQFYKGVINDRSHAVFQGKIFVEKPAQQTNAFQQNNNLLLSDDAEIDTKPELEIYADDVKCSHGATVGDHDPMELFYLRSRGLDRATAESMLTYAFAAEVFERFSDVPLKLLARRMAFERLPGGSALQGML